MEKVGFRGRVQRTEAEVFCKDSEVSQDTLRHRFLKKNLVEYKCAICGLKEWQGKELTLRLDHIDGDNHNNVIENLRWLCPNCDSIQNTYCGKNVKHAIEHPKKYCRVCGAEIAYNSKTDYCGKCYPKNQKRVVQNRPNREELKIMVRTMPFTKIGSMYKVTDNTIRKWCDSYELPRNKSDINSYSEEDWNLI
ncbi:MAG: HNH endonuclease [Bacillota bacterium]|nr:HNH endonuclease [Bacillota bacterium]